MTLTMKKCFCSLVCICLTVFLLFPAFSAPAATGKSESVTLAATIFPLADIARRIAGPDARILQILPSGASPHTFDLTPGQVRELQPARIIFKIGVMDDWIDGIADSLPQAAIVSLNRQVALEPAREKGHDHGTAMTSPTGEFDPHYWLRADNGVIIARQVSNALIKAYPDRAASFRQNLSLYIRELEALHHELLEELTPLKNKKMVVFHDAWRYFAAAYGLEITAVFQASPGREPTPRELSELYALIKKYAIRVIFSEPQLPNASIEPLLHDLGLKLVVLDPLGGTVPGDSYARMLRRNALAIRSALQR
jgi:zinc transport system substrate-binding protein